MTTAGWIFMVLSVTFVVSLAGWSYYKVLQRASGSKDADPQGQD